MPNPSDEEIMKMPLMAHLVELRRRLMLVIIMMIVGTALSFLCVDSIYDFLIRPLANAMTESDTNRLIYTGLTEAFFTYMKVAFFSGMFITFPILLIQIWLFIAPGLYARERSFFLPFLIATPVLFFAGGAFVYYFVMPTAWPFFLSFQSSKGEMALPIQLEARVSEYLDLIMTLIFAFGLCFQIPVFLTLLGVAGLITPEFLARNRRYAIVVMFIIAGVLTPPDVLSQFMLAVPLLLLYEASIILIRLANKKKANDDSKRTA